MDRWIRKETENVTEITERNGVVLLTFPALDRLGMVRAGFSTRHGGVSTGHLAEMNFSFGQGEPKEVVRENYRRAASALGVEPESFAPDPHGEPDDGPGRGPRDRRVPGTAL